MCVHGKMFIFVEVESIFVMVTINDVAKAAGVSKGTVDRVLHNRGEVSARSREKVLKVIEELGYKPNVYASILASQKNYVIFCVIPEFEYGDFWSLTAKGIEEARVQASRYGIRVEVVTYDQYDINSFRKVCSGVLAASPSGVIIAPMFKDETVLFVRELAARQIPYVYIDSRIEEDEDYFAYFGMPMYQSGYLCADILTNGVSSDKVYVVRIERDKEGQSDPTAQRRAGFYKYMSDNYPQTEIVNVFINPKDPESISHKLDAAFSGGVEDRKIVMFNSRIHLVADFLRSRKLTGGRIVGFDFLDKNVAALRDGYVHALIAQHSDSQAAAAVSSFVDRLVLGEDVQKRDNYTQMDILNKYNCDYYM